MTIRDKKNCPRFIFSLSLFKFLPSIELQNKSSEGLWKKKKNQVITTIFTPVLNRNKALEFGYRKLGGNVLGKVALKKGANA